MKKIGIIIIMVCILSGSCSKAVEQTDNRWSATADGMVQALIQNFWGDSFKDTPSRYYFNYQSQMAYMTTEHYWPQAHRPCKQTDCRQGEARTRALYTSFS